MPLSKFIQFHECKQVNGANPLPARRFPPRTSKEKPRHTRRRGEEWKHQNPITDPPAAKPLFVSDRPNNYAHWPLPAALVGRGVVNCFAALLT